MGCVVGLGSTISLPLSKNETLNFTVDSKDQKLNIKKENLVDMALIDFGKFKTVSGIE